MNDAWTPRDEERLELARQGFQSVEAARDFVVFARAKLEPAFAVEAGRSAVVAPLDRLKALLDATVAVPCGSLPERLELLRQCMERGPAELRQRATSVLATTLEADDARRCEFVGGLLDGRPAVERLLLAESAERWGLASIPGTLAEFKPPLSWLRELNQKVLAQHREPEASAALEAIFRVSTWLERRVLLDDVGDPGHAVFLPILVTLARTAEPTTQAGVVEAIRRIGHPGGEPLLLHLLRSGDPGLRGRVVAVLRTVGTRAALAPLYEAARAEGAGAELAAECEQLRAAIVEREGLGAQSGELGLATDFEGSLALAGDEGGLAIYQGVAASVAASPPPPAAPRALGWSRIGLPPRRLSPLLRLTVLLYGHGWGLAASLLLCLAGVADTPTAWMVAAVLGAFPLYAAVTIGVGDLRLLRDGHATVGELLSVEKSVKRDRVRTGTSETAWWTYRVRVIGLDGDDYQIDVKRSHERPEFTDESLEPVLCGAANGKRWAVLADELTAVRLGDDGQWVPAAFAAWTAIPAALVGLGLLAFRLIS
ncbi:MAG: HEAT repeat domain-containing protein [Myxococcota bacterium]